MASSNSYLVQYRKAANDFFRAHKAFSDKYGDPAMDSALSVARALGGEPGREWYWTDFIVVFIWCTLFHFIIAVIVKSVSFFSLPWFIFYVIASIGFIVYEGAQIKNREQEKLNMRKSVQKHEES
jgi:hypothetical protein